MKADYWRQGVATILTAGLLAAGAVAQDGAEGEVNIQDKAPAAASEAEEAPKAAAKPIKPQIVDRDPFVNQLMTGITISGDVSQRPQIKRDPGDDAPAKPTKVGDDDEVVEEVEIPAPSVTVNGIVSSGSGRQAIISTSNGTRMVSTGQKLGDYHVASISTKSVTFSYGGEKNFVIELDAEFGK